MIQSSFIWCNIFHFTSVWHTKATFRKLPSRLEKDAGVIIFSRCITRKEKCSGLISEQTVLGDEESSFEVGFLRVDYHAHECSVTVTWLAAIHLSAGTQPNLWYPPTLNGKTIRGSKPIHVLPKSKSSLEELQCCVTSVRNVWLTPHDNFSESAASLWTKSGRTDTKQDSSWSNGSAF